jgi:hypothetical protein
VRIYNWRSYDLVSMLANGGTPTSNIGFP